MHALELVEGTGATGPRRRADEGEIQANLNELVSVAKVPINFARLLLVEPDAAARLARTIVIVVTGRLSAMGLINTWRSSRLRRRFMSEESVVREESAEGRAPDATVDEVGAPGVNLGFDGHPIRSRSGNGQGSGDPNSPGWAGWGV